MAVVTRDYAAEYLAAAVAYHDATADRDQLSAAERLQSIGEDASHAGVDLAFAPLASIARNLSTQH